MVGYLAVIVCIHALLTSSTSASPEDIPAWLQHRNHNTQEDRVASSLSSSVPFWPGGQDGAPGPDNQWHIPHDVRMSSMLLDFLIRKGCDYLSGFVHTQIQHHDYHDHQDHTTCDWVQWARRQCRVLDVVQELCHALIQCNSTNTLWALDAPDYMYQPCNISSYDSAAAQSLEAGALNVLGKRQLSSYNINMLSRKLSENKQRKGQTKKTSEGKASKNGFVKMLKNLERSSNNQLPDHRSASASLSNTDSSGVSSQQTDYPKWFSNLLSGSGPVSQRFILLLRQIYSAYYKTAFDTVVPANSPEIDNYCQYYSRKLQATYHFEHIPRTSWSKNWITDVYKLSAQAKMPPYLAHGLVGCGMTYARDVMDLKPVFHYFLGQYHR